MDVFLRNFDFIILNSLLALVAVGFGWLMSKAKSNFAKVWTGFLWFIFLPNTFYILTDIIHLFEDWPKVDNLFGIILIIQYSLFLTIGLITFFISVYFFQKMLHKKVSFFVIFILNIIIGFGVVLGGVERVNSWYLLTDPIRVINSAFNLFLSQEMVILSIGMGILANIVYFITLKSIKTWGGKIF